MKVGFLKCSLIVFLLCASLIINAEQNYLYRCNEKLIEVVMEDLFTPPVASRVHVYPNIAAYEVLCLGKTDMISLKGSIPQLPRLVLSDSSVNLSIAAEFAFTTVAKKIVLSEYMITDFESVERELWLNEIKDSIILNKSIEYGKAQARLIIDWILKDNYAQVKAMEKYVLSEKVGAWIPTAPEYTPAIEPHWDLMRTLITDSSSQIKPLPNIAYSENKNSQYYKNAFALYTASISLDTTKKLIAQFWDCNPNISYSKGHLTYFVHKISPGGHWIKIAGQACKNLGFDQYKTAEVYTALTIGLYEGFLSCWSEKYRSEALRPETYINRLIDPNWLPYIQTPPFPEYTSGHSVISSASAAILTDLIPQPYSYVDSSEMYIGIPARSFKSFREAASEASLSRFYGGIHYMPSLDNGILQGAEIGQFVLQKLKFKK
jgi:hypothetical protein